MLAALKWSLARSFQRYRFEYPQFGFFCMNSLSFTRAACSRRIMTSLIRLNSS